MAIALIGLSLLSIAVVFLVGVGTALQTVRGARRRARRCRAGYGALAGSFPEPTLVQLDERLERVWLEEDQRRPASQ